MSKKNTKKKQAGNEKLITTGGRFGSNKPTIILTAPRRGGLGVEDYLSAIKSAEIIDHPRRVKLLDMYQDVKTDSHVFSVLRKQKAAILSTPIVFMRDGKVDEKIIAKQELIEALITRVESEKRELSELYREKKQKELETVSDMISDSGLSAEEVAAVLQQYLESKAVAS